MEMILATDGRTDAATTHRNARATVVVVLTSSSPGERRSERGGGGFFHPNRVSFHVSRAPPFVATPSPCIMTLTHLTRKPRGARRHLVTVRGGGERAEPPLPPRPQFLAPVLRWQFHAGKPCSHRANGSDRQKDRSQHCFMAPIVRLGIIVF